MSPTAQGRSTPSPAPTKTASQKGRPVGGGPFPVGLDNLQKLPVRQGGEGRGGQRLVPEGHRGDVVLQGQVPAAIPPAQGLDGHPQVFRKADGVGDVEPIGPKALLALVQAVLGDGVEAAVGGGELHIAAVGAGVLKIVGAAEVILGAGAADGGGLPVAVQVEFYLPFPHQPLLCTPQAMYVPT